MNKWFKYAFLLLSLKVQAFSYYNDGYVGTYYSQASMSYPNYYEQPNIDEFVGTYYPQNCTNYSNIPINYPNYGYDQPCNNRFVETGYSQAFMCYPDYVCEQPCFGFPNRCASLSFKGEYLYWKAHSENIPYAATSDPNLPGGDTITIQRLEPRSKSGFRIGVNYRLPCFEGYDFNAEWTRFKTDASASVGGTNIVALLVNQVGNPVPEQASASYSLKLNIIDLDIGHAFCVGRRFSLHPHAGFRGFWLDQDIDATYSGGNLGAPITSQDDYNFKGAGLRAGLDAQWRFCYGFSIISHGCVDLLWSRAKIKHQEFNPTARAVTQDTVHSINPVLELFFGLMWEYEFQPCCCASKLALHLGWEEQYIVNGLQFNQYLSDTSSSVTTHQLGGLGVGGLTTGVTLKF